MEGSPVFEFVKYKKDVVSAEDKVNTSVEAGVTTETWVPSKLHQPMAEVPELKMPISTVALSPEPTVIGRN